MKRIAILGSTGSIGRSALAVVDAHPDRVRVIALAAGENTSLLAEQVARYQPVLRCHRPRGTISTNGFAAAPRVWWPGTGV